MTKNRRKGWLKALTILAFIFLFSLVGLRAVLGSPRKLPKHRPYRNFEIAFKSSQPKAIKWLMALEEAKRLKRKTRIAYLTFDDGPDSKVTPVITRILRNAGINGTFFVIGYKVKRHPEIVREAYKDGNTIGDHTYDHNYNNIYASPMAYLNSLIRCNREIKKATGNKANITRPPGGAFHWIRQSKNSSLINKSGFKIFTWNIDCGDGTGRPSSYQIIANVINQTKRWGTHRVIVLFHDTNQNVIGALPHVIRHLRNMGFHFQALDQNVEEMK